MDNSAPTSWGCDLVTVTRRYGDGWCMDAAYCCSCSVVCVCVAGTACCTTTLRGTPMS